VHSRQTSGLLKIILYLILYVLMAIMIDRIKNSGTRKKCKTGINTAAIVIEKK
jgi:hypothetical protein